MQGSVERIGEWESRWRWEGVEVVGPGGGGWRWALTARMSCDCCWMRTMWPVMWPVMWPTYDMQLLHLPWYHLTITWHARKIFPTSLPTSDNSEDPLAGFHFKHNCNEVHKKPWPSVCAWNKFEFILCDQCWFSSIACHSISDWARMLQFPVHIIQVSCDYHAITIQVSCDYHVTYQKNSSFESLPTAETHQLSTQSLKVVGGKLIQYAAGQQMVL